MDVPVIASGGAGDAGAARAAIHEAIAIFEETEDRPGLAGMLQDLGWMELETGYPEPAIDPLERSIIEWRRQLVMRGAGWTAALLAEASEAAGDAPRRNGRWGRQSRHSGRSARRAASRTAEALARHRLMAR